MAKAIASAKTPSLHKSYLLNGSCTTGQLVKITFADGSSFNLKFSNTGLKTDDGKFEIFDIDGEDWQFDTRVIAKENFLLRVYQDGANAVCIMKKVKNLYNKTWKNKTVKRITTFSNPCVFSAPVSPTGEPA